ncbi:MAG: BamA/TamA family outer membrane protein [Paludibacteraceae bacterium]|nr:BamA/TamA family outer membrane protein [Paludibacteraceae bacterium]
MKKYSLFILLYSLFIVLPLSAKRNPKPQEVDSLGRKIKTGWNFGILPSVAYDADYGFQGGVLTNVYFYGDGSQYPEYIHSLYLEAAYTTKHHGIFRFNYDSKYLIPGYRLTLDATYLPDAMCDFYGFNGYQAQYNFSWHNWKKDTAKMPGYQDYRTRVFYKYKRDLIRVAGDIEGTIYHNLKWNAGIGVLGYLVDDCDISMLNGKNEYHPEAEKWDQKALNPDEQLLYDKYKQWGLIGRDEMNGGWHPYLRAGITYDTRDKRQGPDKGIYTDLFFTYTAAFNAAYGQQATAGYNHLRFNFTFRHYVPCFYDKNGQNRITFAYRLGVQNLVAGLSPFYMNNYMNTLFIQRVYYEGLGGGNSIRGMMANRILANGFAFANVEFRFRVVNFDIGRQHFYIGLNPFFDLGLVTQPYDLDELVRRNSLIDYTSLRDAFYDNNEEGERFEDYFNDPKDVYMPHMTAGIGLKIGMNENFVLSADWGMPLNRQDNQNLANFYVKMGYLF